MRSVARPGTPDRSAGFRLFAFLRFGCALVFPALVHCLLGATAVSAQADAWNVEEIVHYARSDTTEYSEVWGYDAPGGTALAIIGYFTGTWFLDVTDPGSPREVASIPGPASVWRDIKTAREHAFIVQDRFSETAGLQVVDLTDPLAPRLVLSTSEFFQRSHNISIDGDRLYAVGTYRERGSPQEVVILDISTPASPVELGRFGLYGFHDIYVRDGMAYGAAFTDGALVVLDVRDPENVVVVSETPDPGGATHNTWLSQDGGACFVTSEESEGYLDIFDLTDPAAPVHVGDWKLAEYPAASIHNVHVEGDLAYCAWYTAGLQILDVRNPRQPQRVGYFDTHPQNEIFLFEGNWGVYPHTRSGLVYLSDINTGFHIVRLVPDHGEIELTVRHPESGDPIAGARIRVDGPSEARADSLDLLTDEAGQARFLLPSGRNEVEVSRFGFAEAVVTIESVAGELRSAAVDLAPVTVGSVSGVVRRSDDPGEPVEGAQLSVLGTPLVGRTGRDGRFDFDGLPVGTWIVSAERFGFRDELVEVTIESGVMSQVLVELLASLYVDDFERESGWTVGAPEDEAVSGIWERADPVGTGLGLVQSEDDHSDPGVHAFITQNGHPGEPASNTDIDGGGTSLLSPLYDLRSLERPILDYHFWFTTLDDSPLSGDSFVVSGSDDAGGTWIEIERVVRSSAEWRRSRIDLGFFLAATERVRFRFVAADGGTGSVVEAGLDDLQIYEGSGEGPPPEPLDAEEPYRLEVSPNPFRGRAQLRLQLAESQSVRLRIHDVVGRCVAELHDGPLASGPHTLSWEGRNDEGERVPAGVYLISIETVSGRGSQRLVRVR